MRIMVTGSRSWPHEATVRTQLAFTAAGRRYVELIHGDCPTGADAIADAFGREQPGWTVTPFPPDRAKGRSGYLERNQAMVEHGQTSSSPSSNRSRWGHGTRLLGRWSQGCRCPSSGPKS